MHIITIDDAGLISGTMFDLCLGVYRVASDYFFYFEFKHKFHKKWANPEHLNFLS